MSIDDVKILIDRFFEGETTLAEERLIYEFFQGDDVPEELMPYKDMFNGLQLAQLPEMPKLEISSEHSKVVRLNYRKIIYAVAASILLAIGVTFAWHFHEEKQLMARYEGSYVIENGQRIDDLTKIKPQIQVALSNAAQIESEVETSEDVIRNAEADVMSKISDPSEREAIRKLLND